MNGFIIVNLLDLLNQYGDEYVKYFLSDFSCPVNNDVEYFLLVKAIEFARQGYSQTHLVFASYKDKPVLVGYFTLANKYIAIKSSSRVISKNMQRRLSKFGHYNEETKSYYISAQLIGQLGKNKNYVNLITGSELLRLACETVKEVQNIVGGKFVYLECEDKERLKEFYKTNGFYDFGQRQLDRDELDDFCGTYLIQMLKYL